MDGLPRFSPGEVTGSSAARPSSEERARFESLLLSHISLVDRVLAFVARRYRLDRMETDELASLVKLKLVENDYGILRKFRGRSRLDTYLVTVIQRILFDERIHRWGKWRPSAEAKRLGPVAIKLEVLLSRDGLSREEACRSLETVGAASRSELEALFSRLPPRIPRREVGEEALAMLPAPGGGVEEGLLARATQEKAQAAEGALREAVLTLPGEDRVILKMRFEGSFTVGDIAQALHLEPRPLYRRLEAILGELRTRLEAAGIEAETVADLLSACDAKPRAPLSSTPEISGARPSKREM
jgi:RNA polymerase sigma factor (sigma-70 family)